MAHYDYIEWLLYKTKALSEEKSEEMEEHLYDCGECMDIFLSLIDEEEIELAGKIVPEDFTEKTISRISAKKVQPVRFPFEYYVAVAAVTIVLTFSGFYTNLVEAVPRISTSIESLDQSPNHIGNLTNRIVNRTSNFIGSIEDLNNQGGKQ